MPSKSNLITRLTGRFWRAGFAAHSGDILTAASAPQGRWHHSGQPALYLSGTPEGCKVALKVYLKPEDPPRAIFPVSVCDANVIDLREPATRDALNTSLEQMHSFWADLHQQGVRPPTWDISDTARALGCDGLLTPSRSRPDLTHLTLFKWNTDHTAHLTIDGPAQPW